jgi:hypothetical protein
MNYIELAGGPVIGFGQHDNKFFDFIKVGKFLMAETL